MGNNHFNNFIISIENSKKELETELSSLFKRVNSIDNEWILSLHQKFSDLINKFEIESQKIRKATHLLDKENKIYLEETAHDLCQFTVEYWEVLILIKQKKGISIPSPSPSIYSTMQKIAYNSKVYSKEEKKILKSKFSKLNLPVRGFEKDSFKLSLGFFSDIRPIILIFYVVLCGVGLFFNKSGYHNMVIIGITITLYATTISDKLSGFPYFILRVATSILVSKTLVSLFGEAIELNGSALGINFKAFGGIAIFIFVYLINPNKTKDLG